ncbi:MAG: T9SS type A sorting domain-containing protein [Bacteroidota bacterium]
MLNKYLLTFFLFWSAYCCYGQTVSTILERSGTTFEAITWGTDGAIYVVDFSTGDVFRMEINGNLTLLTTLNGALGGAVDEAGNYYCSEFNTGRIFKFTPDGNNSLYCSGLIGPAGIVVDDTNQLMYVANYSGNSISVIDMSVANPSPTTLASGGLINGPDGLVFAPNGDLISANFNNNSVQRITPEGNVSQFATLNGSPNSGYLVRRGDDYLITGAYGPAIYQMDSEGNVSSFAGTGAAGTTDGSLTEAQFDFPNGIALSPSGDSLLIAESNNGGRIRLITGLGEISNLDDILIGANVQVFPNPASEQFQLNFELAESAFVQIRLLDSSGRLVRSLVEEQLPGGQFTQQFAVAAQLPEGAYMVQMLLQGDSLTYPIMIQR